MSFIYKTIDMHIKATVQSLGLRFEKPQILFGKTVILWNYNYCYHFKITSSILIYFKMWFISVMVKLHFHQSFLKSSMSHEWMNEWSIYIALYCVLLYTQSALQSCGGVSPQPPPVCSIHLDDATAATGQRHQCAHHTPATGGEERES